MRHHYGFPDLPVAHWHVVFVYIQGYPKMDDRLDEDKKQHLEYLYHRLKLLEQAIRSIEALSHTEDEGDLGSLPRVVEDSEDPT